MAVFSTHEYATIVGSLDRWHGIVITSDNKSCSAEFDLRAGLVSSPGIVFNGKKDDVKRGSNHQEVVDMVFKDTYKCINLSLHLHCMMTPSRLVLYLV
jgi:hypothetical protein